MGSFKLLVASLSCAELDTAQPQLIPVFIVFFADWYLFGKKIFVGKKIVQDGSRNLPLKFDQNQVRNN